jgi:hypothetical protein
LQNLVGDDFRTGERRIKAHVFAVFGFPFGGERRVNFFFERFFHNRKTVNRNYAPAFVSGAPGKQPFVKSSEKIIVANSARENFRFVLFIVPLCFTLF